MVFKTMNLDQITLCVGVDRQEKMKAASVLGGEEKIPANKTEKRLLEIKDKTKGVWASENSSFKGCLGKRN